MNDYLPKKLAGGSLPGFDEITTAFALEQEQGTRILVCFWDKDQRPSRNCIMQLTKQAKQLRQKGVAVVIVQALKSDEQKLKEWVQDNNIPFPVGMVHGDEEKIYVAWGVRSLPWLILTDKDHKVTHEGLAIKELEVLLK